MERTKTSRCGQVLVVGFAVFLLVFSAGAAQFESQASGSAAKQSPRAADRTGAIEKVGFFNGYSGDRVGLVEENTYRKLSFVVDEKMQVFYENQPVDRNGLLIHSLVKLVLVDGIVVEIVLLQESS